MENSSEVKTSNKKRKASDKAKLFTEFKGLNSLVKDTVKEVKKPKLEVSCDSTNQKSHSVDKETRPVRKTYILLDNIDSSVNRVDLMTYLNDNGIETNKVCLVPGPLAVTYFNREKDVDRLFNICQGIHYKNNELLIVRSTMKSTTEKTGATNLSDVSVHLKNLDENTTENDITALLDDATKVQNISINKEKKTAIIDFLDSKSANDCINKLDNHVFGEKSVQASFLVLSQRPDRYSLKVSDLPHGFNKIDIRETFPTASRIKILKGLTRYCQLYFKAAEDLDAVLSNSENFLVKGAKVRVESIAKVTSKKVEKPANFVLNIYNMPFDSTLAEIKDRYPKVRFVEMLKNPDGMFIGSAKLNFEEKEVCEEALKNTKGLTIRHRKIRAEMKLDHVAPKLPLSEEMDQ